MTEPRPYSRQYPDLGKRKTATRPGGHASTTSHVDDVRALTDYAHYLAMQGQALGLTTVDGHRPTADELQLLSDIRRTCDKLADRLSHCRPCEVADLVGYYTILHAMAHHRLPDPAFIGQLRDRVFRQWKSGDKSVTESQIYSLLSEAQHNPAASLPAEQRQALNDLRHKWVNALKRDHTFADADTHERYRRLTLIMRDNLGADLVRDSAAAKREWYEANRLADPARVSTTILAAYRQFICSLCPAVLTAAEMTAADAPLLRQLSTRPDLSPHSRRAYLLALTQRLAINQKSTTLVNEFIE